MGRRQDNRLQDGRRAAEDVSTPFGLRIHQDEILRIEGDGAGGATA